MEKQMGNANVAFYFDGRNFYHNLTAAYRSKKRVNFKGLVTAIFEHIKVPESCFLNASYYTGIDPHDTNASNPSGFARFLTYIEANPGFDVIRIPRVEHHSRCADCGVRHTFWAEKEVDTRIAVDIVSRGLRGLFSTVVLFSGDADLAPAVDALKEAGVRCYVACWGTSGLSPRIRKAAFDIIDLGQLNGVIEDNVDNPDRPVHPVDPDTAAAMQGLDDKQRMLLEVKRAQYKMRAGFLGLSFFVYKWQSPFIDSTPEVRQALLDTLVSEGGLEAYKARFPDGKPITALRAIGYDMDRDGDPIPKLPVASKSLESSSESVAEQAV